MRFRVYSLGFLLVMIGMIVIEMAWATPGLAAPVDPQVIHVLNRLSYGPRPGDVAQVSQMGIQRYIETQLNPSRIAESPILEHELSTLETLSTPELFLFSTFNPILPAGVRRTAVENNMRMELSRNMGREATQGKVLRSVLSQRQLETQMTDFWFNHFNVWIGNVNTRPWLESYTNQALRPHALGKFRDLLGTTARHPAMMRYLDNWLNTGVGTPGARRRFQGLNENYARELLELHTLGVDGGYTQADVIALAKIFTGWGFPPPRVQGQVSGAFYFDPNRHDFSDKVFLGQTIKGTGITEGEQALDILARHPATARHIGYKLAQYFVADEPPVTLVNQLAQRYLATDGDIRQVLSALFNSSEFWNPQYYGAKFKTPYQYLISGLRATGANSINTLMVRNTLMQLGMPIYGCSTPDGYKNTQEAWLNPDGMIRRINIAVDLGQGKFSRSQRSETPGPTLTAEQLTETLGNMFSPATQSVVATSPPQLQAALLLGSPEFMKR